MDSYDGELGHAENEIVTATSIAYVNFIHNSGDLSNSVVDIRLNGELTIDDISFRTNSTYIQV